MNLYGPSLSLWDNEAVSCILGIKGTDIKGLASVGIEKQKGGKKPQQNKR